MKKYLLCAISFFTLTALTNEVKSQIVYFNEDFSTGALPLGWTNDSLGFTPVDVWFFDNPYSRNITGAGFDSTFAIFDSDHLLTNDNVDENTSLTTSLIDISAATGSLFIVVDEQYRNLAGPNTQGSSRRIETSVDSGATWSTIVYDSTALGYPNPAVTSNYDISAAVGSPTLKVRFTWTGTYDWWWAIDNLNIQNTVTTKSINITNNLKGIKVFPNLTSGNIYINADRSLNNSTVAIYDITGKLIDTKILSSGNQQMLDLSSFNNGVYFLKIMVGSETTTTKVIISK